ncbi:MAG: hypothetical protein WBZ36_11380 [Candidatus Nitrosopolaris sp.]
MKTPAVIDTGSYCVMVDKRKKPTNKQLNVSVEVYDRLKLKFGESFSDVIARTLKGLEKK